MENKLRAIGGSILLMAVLQLLREGAERLLSVYLLRLSGKMLTMCAMLLLWLLVLGYMRLRRAAPPVFPKPFSRFYIIATLIAAALFISTPANYIIGLPAVLELIYASIVTPVFEETVFRGYLWERLERAFENEKAVYLATSLLFALWHLGYMIPQLIAGNWFAVLTKLAAGAVYGFILGYVRLKCKNLYLPAIVHGVMNIFMF